jgi:hypothetical protein
VDSWDRDELYKEVWDQPLTKLVTKYGISAVALGKVCRKLQIPLPGRGYWAKKEFGKAGERVPLPALEPVPVVWRMKFPPPEGTPEPAPAPEPTDSEWLRIKEVESRTIQVRSEPKYHKLVAATLKSLSGAKTDEHGFLVPRPGTNSLDARVSPGTLDRALKFLNCVIEVLEAEGPSPTVTGGRHGTIATVFNQAVQFSVVEKMKETGRRQVKDYSWTKTIIDYEPSGKLEFRVGSQSWYTCRTLRDGKKRQIENQIPEAIGAIMREGRDLRIREERKKQEEIERQQRAKERIVLSEQIREEEGKVKQLESWVDAWLRAKQMRDFISELEKKWTGEGRDLSPEATSGQRLAWMKQQADRLDPLISTKARSVLDRKGELTGWY